MGAYIWVIEQAVLPAVLVVSLFVILPTPLFVGLGIALAFAHRIGRVDIRKFLFPEDKARIDADGKITWKPER